MRCPCCLNTDLVTTLHHGVEVDLCPVCRGVWFDRGEFEVVLARGGTDPDRVAVAVEIDTDGPGTAAHRRPREPEIVVRGWPDSRPEQWLG